MLLEDVNKKNLIFQTLSNVLIESFSSHVLPMVKQHIAILIDVNFEFVERRWANLSEYIEFYQNDLLYYINGSKETRLKFIDTFEKKFIEKANNRILPEIVSKVSEYYVDLSMKEMRQYISESKDAKELILQLVDKVLIEIACTNRVMSQNNSSPNIDTGNAFANAIVKEIQKIIDSLINDERYSFSTFYLQYQKKFADTMQYFFIEAREVPYASSIIDGIALESISDAENELEILPDFSINKDDLINGFVSKADNSKAKIEFTPEDCIKEDCQRERYLEEMDKALVEKEKQDLITRKSCKIRENDTGYSYEILFDEILDGARTIVIHDSYIVRNYQLNNLAKFCAVAKKLGNPEKIKLITKQCNKNEIDDSLKEFKQNLKMHKIEFEVEYSTTIMIDVLNLTTGGLLFLVSD